MKFHRYIPVALFIFPLIVNTAKADPSQRLPFQITRECSQPYEKMEEAWSKKRVLKTWTGVSQIMTECELDDQMAAKSIEIVVDKAGLDEKAEAPSTSTLPLLEYRLNPLRKKQKLYVRAELMNGKVLTWNYLVSTGNRFADDKNIANSADETPTGSFDIGRANSGLDSPQKIQNSQAYCVAGKQYNYVGAPMPYSVFFKGGYALHSGIVTGKPASHGCVRQDPQNAKKLYCLLRQKATVTYSKNKKPAEGENFMVTKLKICENLSQGCDENGKTQKLVNSLVDQAVFEAGETKSSKAE